MIAIIVVVVFAVIVIIVCLKHLKYKKRACQRDRELQLEETREEHDFCNQQTCQKQDEKKEANLEIHRQWSREKVDRLLDELKDMRKTVFETNDKELLRKFLGEYTKMIREIYGKFLSPVATDGDVVTDSEEERNEEIEMEQKEQLLNLLREILKGGRRNKSLKGEMLRTIVDEVGSDVNDYVDQKCQCTCL